MENAIIGDYDTNRTFILLHCLPGYRLLTGEESVTIACVDRAWDFNFDDICIRESISTEDKTSYMAQYLIQHNIICKRFKWITDSKTQVKG